MNKPKTSRLFSKNPQLLIPLIAILLLVAGVALSVVAERIQKRYDIDTFREVEAFLDGADPSQIERNRKVPKPVRATLQMVAGAVVAIVFMAMVYLVIAVTGIA